MKPCETGDGDDALRLIEATGRALDASLVNPYRFALPAAPEIAAHRERAQVELHVIARAYSALAADAERVLVEGAGGVLVPLAERCTMADLAAHLRLPVLIVARTRLGTINHTVLTAEALRHRGLRIVGAVFSRSDEQVGDEEQESMDLALRDSALRCFGVLPYLDGARELDRLAAAVEQNLRLDELLAALDDA